jgi:hypothetical protein
LEIKIADEVWIGCALLHNENPHKQSFTNDEILRRIEQENIYGSIRAGVPVHISQHCAANKPANPNKCRMLYNLPDGTKRLFKNLDNYHTSRENGKTKPNPEDIPQKYLPLLKWYNERYSQSQGQKNNDFPPKAAPINHPPQVEAIPFSNESELKNFAYKCPEKSGARKVCKKCPLFIEEDEVKKAVVQMLKADGWTVNRMALGQTHGVDIEATHKLKGTVLIEAKGEGSLNPMRVNYFLMVLGELIQKMDTPNKQYGIGLPANSQYAHLIIKLPLWIKQHLKLKVFLVKKLNGEKYVVGCLAY